MVSHATYGFIEQVFLVKPCVSRVTETAWNSKFQQS